MNVLFGLPWWLSGNESVCQAGDKGLSLGWEDPLEEKMATHFSILTWRIPWTEELRRARVHGVAESDTTQ